MQHDGIPSVGPVIVCFVEAFGSFVADARPDEAFLPAGHGHVGVKECVCNALPAAVRADGEMAQLRAKAEQTGAQEDAQAYNDYANLMERFDKKINDLELTRMISIQMGPQTRLLQNNDTLMIEKIQTSLVNTIPLWKSQMVLALGLERSRQATAAQSAVTNMTNELLRKNAEMLKMGTIATAKEAERGVVDIETLRKTNEDLISTLDEVMKIQTEGRQKRREAEVELTKIEGDLRQKLMELRH